MTVAGQPSDLDALLAGDFDHPLIFVTVGSDHHRFDRLVRWMDAWVARQQAPMTCIVQFGTADPPRSAIGVDYVDHALLQRLLASADVVVVQGGPMSIIESRRHGRRPIAVPRVASLDEVVDDHQRGFCAKLAKEDLIELAEDEATLHRHLDVALAEPAQMTFLVDDSLHAPAPPSIDRIRRIAAAVTVKGGQPSARVLLLGGSGRSGSTLLERLLAGVPGVVALGEVIHLWERGLVADELCGCGRPFSTCAFWTGVGARAFGGWDHVEAEDVVAGRRSVVRTRQALTLLGGPTSPKLRLQRDRLSRTVRTLYAAAREQSGAQLLIDSSKHPAYAMLLRRAHVDLRCVLLVRDPRAVAYSWQRSVRRPEILERDVDMPRYGLAYSSLTWTLFAALYEALRMLRVPLLVVRYEDLLSAPHRELRKILDFADVPPSMNDLAHVSAAAAELGPAHTVAGNPMRFVVGKVPLRLDEDWRDGLSTAEKHLVSFLTSLLRRRYGYR